jgi:tetratricopeptide (TPR) repeat protein
VTNRLFFVALLLAYALIVVPFTGYLKNRPVAVKLGVMPEAQVLRVMAADHRNLVAEYAVVKVLFYFGTLFEKNRNQVVIKPEFYNMFKTLERAVKLDPYNMDAYYFTQAAFTWELGRARDVNKMLQYGMKYRTWDYQLPFYVGFNSAFFLKDYKEAAIYMKRAAELSGDPLFTSLAARYFYESGRNDLGIAFLETMAKEAKDKDVRHVYEVRLKALRAIGYLENAVEEFLASYKRLPSGINELKSSGIIREIPVDPYGGRFYIEPDGTVRTTSKLAYTGQQSSPRKPRP